jgi:hypothetical protein
VVEKRRLPCAETVTGSLRAVVSVECSSSERIDREEKSWLHMRRRTQVALCVPSTSPGTAQHLGGELVKKMAGVDMVHIAYKGTGAVMPDLLSGRVPMMFENLAVMTPHIRTGSLRPLAVSSAKRTHLMPDVPTVSETGMGLEGCEVLGWFASSLPRRRPRALSSSSTPS